MDADEGARMMRSYFDGGLKALPRHEPLDQTTLEPGRQAILESSKECTTMLLARLSGSSKRATLDVVAESRRERDSLVDGCLCKTHPRAEGDYPRARA